MSGPNTSNAIVTRLRKRRDLEATMTTLKQLLEPSAKKGTRKKNKPRILAKKATKEPTKTVKRYENTKDDGEYYPNKLKRRTRLKKTLLKPRHELQVVVATNKRKRGTPLKGLKSPDEEQTDCKQEQTRSNSKVYEEQNDINASNNTSVHTYNVSETNTEQTASDIPACITKVETVDLTESIGINVTNDSKAHKTNAAYKLISPPHKSLTQMTVDDLIRMDEDSLSGEDMMEILTCPSPVWWEDPVDVSSGTVFLTQATVTSIIQQPSQGEENTTSHEEGKTSDDGGKATSDDGRKLISHDGTSFKRASVSVTASKARKIAKLENILGHIKSLVRSEIRRESLDNNHSVAIDDHKGDKDDNIDDDRDDDKGDDKDDDKSDNKDADIDDEIDNEIYDDVDNDIDDDTDKDKDYDINDDNSSDGNDSDFTVHNDDEDNDIVGVETDDNNAKTKEVIESNTKRRTISSSGSEISVNDDLLHNLESINIPIEKRTATYSQSPVNVNKTVTENVTPIKENTDIHKRNVTPIKDNTDIQNRNNKVSPRNESVVGMKGVVQNNFSVSNRRKNKKVNYDNSVICNKKAHIRHEELPGSRRKEDISKSNKSILRRLRPKNDDILDVTLLKVPTNVSNEIKVWSQLDNFKKHNFKPSDFDDKPIDVDEEEIPINNEEQDPLDIHNEPIFIDDDSLDATDVNKGVIEQPNDVTITPVVENNATSRSSEFIDLDTIPKDINVDDRGIIKEDTIRISKDLDVRLIETSNVLDTSSKPKRKSNFEIKNAKMKPSSDLRGVRILPKSTLKSVEQSPNDSGSELRRNWHVSQYINFDKQTNERGIFRVDDPDDDATDTILCLNDVDVSLVKNPRPTQERVPHATKIDELNDVSITIVSKPDVKGLTKHPKLTESPKSLRSVTSETLDYSEGTISDTNIQFLDEYEGNQKENEMACLKSNESENYNVDNDLNVSNAADIEAKGRQDMNLNQINTDRIDSDDMNRDQEERADERSNEIDKNDVIEIDDSKKVTNKNRKLGEKNKKIPK